MVNKHSRLDMKAVIHEIGHYSVARELNLAPMMVLNPERDIYEVTFFPSQKSKYLRLRDDATVSISGKIAEKIMGIDVPFDSGNFCDKKAFFQDVFKMYKKEIGFSPVKFSKMARKTYLECEQRSSKILIDLGGKTMLGNVAEKISEEISRKTNGRLIVHSRSL